MTGISPSEHQQRVRATLTRHLVGHGLELGPGHSPFKILAPNVAVSYVDRWEPTENRELFPELGEAAPFPRPDIVANLDTERLSAVESGSQDFVIASHVLEHLANPLSQLAEIQRVLKDGGVALILLPDRRFTFDKARWPTPLSHLVDEFAQDVQAVDDAHVEDFCRGTGERVDDWTAEERRKQFDWHLQRSIHVHCWSQDEFVPVLEHAVQVVGMQWDLVDAVFVEDVPDGYEFGFVLRKASMGDAATDVARMRYAWDALRERSEGVADRARAAEQRNDELESALEAADARARRERERAERVEAVHDRIRASPAYPLARAVWHTSKRARAMIRRDGGSE